jgi:hypothetical protein
LGNVQGVLFELSSTENCVETVTLIPTIE